MILHLNEENGQMGDIVDENNNSVLHVQPQGTNKSPDHAKRQAIGREAAKRWNCHDDLLTVLLHMEKQGGHGIREHEMMCAAIAKAKSKE